MSASEIREKLHKYIDNVDEILLNEIYRIYSEDDALYNYSADDIASFYKRREAYQNDEGKNYSVNESFNNIRN